jgi:hypothetical protein
LALISAAVQGSELKHRQVRIFDLPRAGPLLLCIRGLPGFLSAPDQFRYATPLTRSKPHVQSSIFGRPKLIVAVTAPTMCGAIGKSAIPLNRCRAFVFLFVCVPET